MRRRVSTTLWLCLALIWTLQLGACKAKDKETKESDTSMLRQDAPSSDDEAEEKAPERTPEQAADDEERRQERAQAEKQRKRFIDPELVRAVRAQSGLIDLPPPDVERLLRRADLRDIMLYTGGIRTEPLAGKAPDGHYNAVRFAMGRELGCSIQRWTFPFAHDLVLHFDDYVETLYKAEKEARVDAATYFSTFAGVRTVVMRHNASRSMIQLSCTESMLSQQQLRRLSERVISRL